MSGHPKPARGKNPRAKTIALSTALIVITAILWIIYFVTGSEWNTPSIHWLPLAILATISSLVIFCLRIAWASSKKPSSFNLWIYGVTIIGGSIAFLFPLVIADYIGKDSEGSALRQMIIYATGGLLGAITLSETRRKNDLERSKFDKQNDQFTEQLNAQKENLKTELEAQKENLKTQLDAQKENLKTELEAQKENLKTQLDSQLESQKEQINSQNEKDIRDHIRQVHAERRSRYAKAIEQLSDQKAVVRLGGVYTLVGLVDEWLADINLDEKSKRKEGQVIINNLCSYIRSPFHLVTNIEDFETGMAPINYGEEEFIRDQAAYRGEQDIRRAIFVEISRRSTTITKDEQGNIFHTPGTWSGFEYDFSRAPIFYPLNDLTIEQAIFSSAKFYGEANFFQTTFIREAEFICAQFTRPAKFFKATFFPIANFIGATFNQEAGFASTTFYDQSDFLGTTFSKEVSFFNATFKQYGPTFALGNSRAQFSALADPRDYIFKTDVTSPNDIGCGTAKLINKPFSIPLGTVLYDPDSWDEEKQEYTRVSKPAK